MGKENGDEISENEPSAISRLTDGLNRMPPILGLGAILVVAAALWVTFLEPQSPPIPTQSPEELQSNTDLLKSLSVNIDQLPEFSPASQDDVFFISRLADLHTVIPDRPRIEISEYEVKEGDTLFGISENFNLTPETILWGNWYSLSGDPHSLRPGQILNILPVNGVLHQWSSGEGLNGVASFYGVTAEEIIEWPGNNLEPNIDTASPPIAAGTQLVVPGGRREPPSWQMISITRSDPAVAKVLGPGYCGSVYSGSIGDGVFGWPTSSTGISGYSFIPSIHEAIDIGGAIGVGISASDDGVVVYAGWNDWGYGYVVVIDHGNGWQTLYAHLSQINVGCGQSLSQGQLLGLMGCTGNCTGPHLHFEMRHDVWGRVNPLTILP
jgi:murein DD-endopeptidase MepM/ murein hydrolase activator NlpD